MTGATATVDRSAPVAHAHARPGLPRLTAVELRKMVDTRAGFWLQLAVVALTVVAVTVLCIVGDAKDQTLRVVLSLAVQPAAILLPVVGILLVSSEWSQRTSLITFTLAPWRLRVLTAKLLAAVALSIVALVLALAVSAVGTAAAAPGVDHTWSLPIGLLGQDALYLASGVVMGVAFGAALLSPAPGIVLFFVLPISLSAIGSIHALEGTVRWLDTESLGSLTDELYSGAQWARAGTTLALWVLVPLAIGAWRIARSEIS
jgi:ABC-2 type transport system permease protein